MTGVTGHLHEVGSQRLDLHRTGPGSQLKVVVSASHESPGQPPQKLARSAGFPPQSKPVSPWSCTLFEQCAGRRMTVFVTGVLFILPVRSTARASIVREVPGLKVEVFHAG